jgi:hypothetical protein
LIKVQKTAKQTKNPRKPKKRAQENKKEKPRKQKMKPYRIKTWRELMGRGHITPLAGGANKSVHAGRA